MLWNAKTRVQIINIASHYLQSWEASATSPIWRSLRVSVFVAAHSIVAYFSVETHFGFGHERVWGSLMLFFPSFFWWNHAAMIVASVSSLPAQSLSGGCEPHDQPAMATFRRPQPTFDNLRFYFSIKRVVGGSSLFNSLLSVWTFGAFALVCRFIIFAFSWKVMLNYCQ